MKKKGEKPAPRPKEKPFFRPFEGVAKQLAKKPNERASKNPAPPTKPPAEHEAGALPPDATFAELMYGVERLQPGKRRSPAPDVVSPPGFDDAVLARHAREDEAVREHLRRLVSGGDARFEIQSDGRRIEGRRIDVDPKVVRRLRRGEFTIDADVDLHGETTYDARAKLEEFLQKCATRGERTVLVVHGKGVHSPRGIGVLRGEMAAWLTEGPASVHVAAFTSALPDDGGDGALYVLLR